MSKLTKLRLAAREIWIDALHAVKPDDAVRRAVQFRQGSISIGDLLIANRCVYSIAVGKAAPGMATALDQILGQALTGGLLVGPRRLTSEIPLGKSWSWWPAGHPLPTGDSLFAAERALELLGTANAEHALVIFLVSGGGSAMIEWPISEDITLENLRMANQALVASGASIGEINAVRRAFSFIKGGRLAAKAPQCDQVTLIVSDVPRGQEWNVASGPTLSPPRDSPNAREVVARYQLRNQLPGPIQRALDAEKELTLPEDSPRLRAHLVLLSNDDVLEAAARAAQHRGFAVEVARDISDEPIESGCERLLQRISKPDETSGKDLCVISGGEFSCPVRGDGLGGRNLETALRLAIAGANLPGFVALCAGTDGIDGNSPAAGAIVDNTTSDRAKKIGLDPQDFLNRSDAYSFFVALGDAITTGPTGTNVRDLRILLQSSERKQIDT